MTPETPGPFVSPSPQYVPGVAPERHVADADLVWTADEQAQIDAFRAQYPTPDGAVMKTLWLAQRKFDWLPPEVLKLVAETLGIPYAKVYGVATFYTMYFKEKKGTFVLDVCTCFSCQVCGGYDMLHYLEDKLGVSKGETTEDGLFTIQEAECLGACGSAPMLQVTNGPYVHNLTKEKIDTMVDTLRDGKALPFESVTLPQDADEMGGNRRTDAEATETYQTPPTSETIR
ncbi:NADH-quinone oxidoreductase subunit NuoE [Rubrivirga sp. IMCC45206]|uniref:NADH-quinone oxidoreductase subunit NuoE family protein n=1 Tax=Rubrivirga sp. IMCC45206 TaxID=3391614 RepID=UPI00398FDC43